MPSGRFGQCLQLTRLLSSLAHPDMVLLWKDHSCLKRWILSRMFSLYSGWWLDIAGRLWIPLKHSLSISKQNPKAKSFFFPRFQALESYSKIGKSCDEYSQAFQISSKSSWKSWEAHPSICKICVALPVLLPSTSFSIVASRQRFW